MHSRVTVRPAKMEGGAEGAIYLELPGTVHGWCEQFLKPHGASCEWTQGESCDADCKEYLKNILPSELVVLKAWLESRNFGVAPPEPATYTWSPRVTTLLSPANADKTYAMVARTFTTVSESALAEAGRSGRAMILIHSGWLADCQLTRKNPCPVYVTKAAACPGFSSERNKFCMPEHWVFLEKCDVHNVCALWSWAGLYYVQLSQLAKVTLTIISA